MDRRQFLGLMAALTAAGAAGPAVARSLAASDRLTWWDPAPVATTLGTYVALEWRYLAGRITTESEDFGFVVSIADYNPLIPFVTANYQELLVMRQDFTGAGAHATKTYGGSGVPTTYDYNTTTATYSFSLPGNPAVSLSWRLDDATQTYTLSVATPELTLSNLVLTPRGNLIPEGGTGTVKSGSLTVNNTPVSVTSDYYADWVAISSGGQPIGLARLDMQTLKPTFDSTGGGGFSHHWFCLACTLEDDTEAWITGWEIVSGTSLVWGYTRATGSGGAWSVSSTTEQTFSGIQPLGVQILAWQDIPNTSPARRTGQRWRIEHGQNAAGDALAIELSVPPGQFVQGARISTVTNIAMQESAGTEASGTIGGKAIKAVSFAIAESTYNQLTPPAGLEQRAFLPFLQR